MRIDGSRFRSIVVAKNTVYGATWQLNVYTWDSGRSPYFRTHGAVSLRAPFAQGRVRMRAWLGGEGVPLGDGADSIVSVLPAGGLLAGLAELLESCGSCAAHRRKNL